MKNFSIYGNKKRENGAISLFVLIACLFFVMILMGMYLSTVNRLQVQEQEVQQIQENYVKEIDRVDEIYEELGAISELKITQIQDGALADTSRKFLYNLTITRPSSLGINEEKTYIGYIYDKNNQLVSEINVTFAKGVNETTVNYEIGHYDYFAISLPVGTKYMLEKIDSSKSYTLSFSIKENGETILEKTAAEGENIIIENMELKEGGAIIDSVSYKGTGYATGE